MACGAPLPRNLTHLLTRIFAVRKFQAANCKKVLAKVIAAAQKQGFEAAGSRWWRHGREEEGGGRKDGQEDQKAGLLTSSLNFYSKLRITHWPLGWWENYCFGQRQAGPE